MRTGNIYKIFIDLQNNNTTTGQYVVDSFHEQLPHKLGCSADGFPVFFIKCSDEAFSADIKLALFSVIHNRVCDIINRTTGEQVTGKFSVLQMSSHEQELQRYFLEVILLLLLKLPNEPGVWELDSNIRSIIALFTSAKQPSQEMIRGLFAELLTIYLSNDPHYMLKAWHVTPQDKFDFNDGIDKIEVKSYTGEVRKHTFSAEQLHVTGDSKMAVASTHIIPCGIGISVNDLVDEISLKVQNDHELLLHLREIVASTVGAFISEISSYKYDLSTAKDFFAIYDYNTIPKIDTNTIPHEVSNVHYTVDFSSLVTMEPSEETSKLISCII